MPFDALAPGRSSPPSAARKSAAPGPEIVNLRSAAMGSLLSSAFARVLACRALVEPLLGRRHVRAVELTANRPRFAVSHRSRVPLARNHRVGMRPIGIGVGHGKPPVPTLQVMYPFTAELARERLLNTVEQHACLARSTVPPGGDLDRAGRQLRDLLGSRHPRRTLPVRFGRLDLAVHPRPAS